MALTLWKEDIGGGHVTVHADGADAQGRTLCGYAYEGECRRNGDSPVEEIKRGKITCRPCQDIIFHCKAIPARALARDNR